MHITLAIQYPINEEQKQEYYFRLFLFKKLLVLEITPS